MKIEDLKDKKVAVLGLGIEGIALVSFLTDKVSKLTVLDSANQQKILENSSKDQIEEVLSIFKNQEIEKIFGDGYIDNLARFDVVFRSPSIYFNHEKLVEARQSGAQISSQMNLFFDLCPCKIVGVTGTKGKGTTASLIFEILKLETRDKRQETNVFLAGNIGYPAITLIPKLKKEDIVVLELSNFQLADLQKSPHVAVVTNLDVDHLDYHKSIEEYHDAKKSILSHQLEEDYAVLNSESKFETSFISNLKSNICYFSAIQDGNSQAFAKEVDGKAGVFLKRGDGREEPVCFEDEISLLGRHNLENIAAASIVGDIFGIEIANISTAVKNTVGLPYRTEFVAEIDGVKYINDSFATNPRPTIAAIKSFKQDKVLILGGSSKGADFSEMGKLIAKSNVSSVVLIGVEGEKIKAALLHSNYAGVILEDFSNLDEVVKKVYEIAKPGGVVIFSPACASFDMFKNYKDRGEKFKAAVLKYQSKITEGHI